MKVRPLKNRLLVQIVENEESTKSGIILAGTAKEESNIAKVIETSDYLDDEQEVLLKGDKVLLCPGVGTKVKIDEKEYLVVSQEDVLAVLSY